MTKRRSIKRGAIERHVETTETLDELLEWFDRPYALEVDHLRDRAKTVAHILSSNDIEADGENPVTGDYRSPRTDAEHMALYYNTALQAIAMWDRQNWNMFGQLMYELGQISVEVQTWGFIPALEEKAGQRERMRQIGIKRQTQRREDDCLDERDAEIILAADRLIQRGFPPHKLASTLARSHGNDWPQAKRIREILQNAGRIPRSARNKNGR